MIANARLATCLLKYFEGIERKDETSCKAAEAAYGWGQRVVFRISGPGLSNS